MAIRWLVATAPRALHAQSAGDSPRTAQEMVAATVRSVFEQPGRAAAQAQLRLVSETLGARFPRVVAALAEAEEEVLSFYDFPPEHWRQIRSTNPLERLNSGSQRFPPERFGRRTRHLREPEKRERHR